VVWPKETAATFKVGPASGAVAGGKASWLASWRSAAASLCAGVTRKARFSKIEAALDFSFAGTTAGTVILTSGFLGILLTAWTESGEVIPWKTKTNVKTAIRAGLILAIAPNILLALRINYFK
jgi:hypothetical protein